MLLMKIQVLVHTRNSKPYGGRQICDGISFTESDLHSARGIDAGPCRVQMLSNSSFCSSVLAGINHSGII